MNAQRPEPELMEREPALPDSGTMLAITRAEIDGQIATARAFPRSVAAFVREARELVSVDEETAESCIYSLPRGKNHDGSKKYITGASARFAEIIMYSFGNNRGGGRVVAIEKDVVVAQGVFHDLEKNVQVTKEVQRSILDSYGKRYKPDMIGVTGNAAISIALRNAVLAGIPQALWLPIYEAARQAAVGDVTTLATRRQNALAWFGKVGIAPERIFAQLGVEGIEDIGIEELETLVGIKTAIRKGDVTPEAAFKAEPEGVPGHTSKDAVADMAAKLAARQKKPEPSTMTTKDIKAALQLAETVDAVRALDPAIEAIPDDAEREELKVLQDSRMLALQ